MDQIQNRYDRLDYLLETTHFTSETLLHELVMAMGDQDFHANYNYICRMHDIEPDIDKFNERMFADMSQ